MKVLLLGATGRVGNQLLELLLNSNHEVIALVRDPQKLNFEHSSLTVISGNTLNFVDLDKVTSSQITGVISALNTDGNYTLSKTMDLLIPLLESKKIERFVTIGTAGILQSRSEPNTLRYLSSESKRKSTSAAADHQNAYFKINSSKLEWTIVCPTYLPDGPITKQYRLEKDFLPINGSSISTGDTAYFAFIEFFHKNFVKTRVGISY